MENFRALPSANAKRRAFAKEVSHGVFTVYLTPHGWAVQYEGEKDNDGGRYLSRLDAARFLKTARADIAARGHESKYERIA